MRMLSDRQTGAALGSTTTKSGTRSFLLMISQDGTLLSKTATQVAEVMLYARAHAQNCFQDFTTDAYLAGSLAILMTAISLLSRSSVASSCPLPTYVWWVETSG
jgi:hypothetical protein